MRKCAYDHRRHTGHRKDGDSARLRTEIEIGTN